MCREKLLPPELLSKSPGSPLRVQGKEAIHLQQVKAIRITPACAGKRRKKSGNRITLKDHPCVCREKNQDGWYE